MLLTWVMAPVAVYPCETNQEDKKVPVRPIPAAQCTATALFWEIWLVACSTKVWSWAGVGAWKSGTGRWRDSIGRPSVSEAGRGLSVKVTVVVRSEGLPPTK
jgi:hypothetical protein